MKECQYHESYPAVFLTVRYDKLKRKAIKNMFYILDNVTVLPLPVSCSPSSPSSRLSGSDIESTVPSRRYFKISLLDKSVPTPA